MPYRRIPRETKYPHRIRSRFGCGTCDDCWIDACLLSKQNYVSEEILAAMWRTD